MSTRNALLFVVAAALSAAAAGAQQPKPAPSTTKSTTAQAPSSSAKKSSKTSAAAALPVSADSAKKIVAANASGATVSSAHLKHSGGKAYYAVSYKMKGEKNSMHATVDANTGAFATVAPAATTTTKSAKKPS
jgi:uncharacterized membrane protein YkoI